MSAPAQTVRLSRLDSSNASSQIAFCLENNYLTLETEKKWFRLVSLSGDYEAEGGRVPERVGHHGPRSKSYV